MSRRPAVPTSIVLVPDGLRVEDLYARHVARWQGTKVQPLDENDFRLMLESEVTHKAGNAQRRNGLYGNAQRRNGVYMLATKPETLWGFKQMPDEFGASNGNGGRNGNHSATKRNGSEIATNGRGTTMSLPAPVAEIDVRPKPCSKAEAQAITDMVRDDAETLERLEAAQRRLLLEAYESEAHRAMGYSSWEAYCATEHGKTRAAAHRVVDWARVERVLEADSPMGESPLSERVARELGPVLKKEGEQAMIETWADAVEQYGRHPTAAQVQELVKQRAQARGTRLP